jgi:hypothetical protein
VNTGRGHGQADALFRPESTGLAKGLNNRKDLDMHTTLKLAILITGWAASLITSSLAHAGAVERCPPSNPYPSFHQVMLFQHAFYRSQCFLITVEDGEFFDMKSVSAFGIPNDSISSVITGNSVDVSMYEHADHKGIFVGMPGDSAIPQLSRYNFNDKLSSMIVHGH